MDRYAKKNVSTKQPAAGKKTRLSHEDEHTGGPQRDQEKKEEGSKTTDALSLLDLGLPKEHRLRKPADFRRVYSGGERIKGRFLTAFFVPSETSFQRVGITASKKAVGNAVKRNRAKRLLRETFRLCRPQLNELANRYDWVLNARFGLTRTKLSGPLEEFRGIIAKVKEREQELNKGAGADVIQK